MPDLTCFELDREKGVVTYRKLVFEEASLPHSSVQRVDERILDN